MLGLFLVSLAPGIDFRLLLPPAPHSMLFGRIFGLVFLQEKEDWRRRDEYSLGVDLEDLKLRPDQPSGMGGLSSLVWPAASVADVNLEKELSICTLY